MKALVFNKTGEPDEVLELKDVDKPTPGPNEVSVKILGSPVHPADLMFIRGQYRFKPEFPQTAGLEGAGIVEAAGDNSKTPKGTLVAFSIRKSWAEYVVAPETELIMLPDNFPAEKAVQFCLNPFTAWGLLKESGIQPGGWLLLTAGNSTVSRIIIQLARIRNIHTVAVVRNIRQSETLKTLGADAVLNPEDNNFDDEINNLTDGKGINAALDAVGGDTGSAVIKNIAPYGRVIIYGRLDNNPARFYNSQILFKNLIIKGFGVRGYLQNQTKQQRDEMLNFLTHELAEPFFEMPVEGSYPLKNFKDALAANSKSNRKGKIIFKP